MGVKSTVTLTRKEAEERWVELSLEATREAWLRAASVMTNEVLENDLERLNDERSHRIHGGSGSDNYRIEGD